MADENKTVSQLNLQLATELVAALAPVRHFAETLAKKEVEVNETEFLMSMLPQSCVDQANELRDLLESVNKIEHKTKEHLAIAHDASNITSTTSSLDDQLKALERVEDRSREIWKSEIAALELRLIERQDQQFAQLEQHLLEGVKAMLIKQAEGGNDALRKKEH